MSGRIDFSEFCKALCAFADLEAKLNKKEPDPVLLEKIKILSAGIFRIVVMGEIKKGKSSFINAMLGVENLVPVSTDVATSTIYKICYGEKLAYKVFFTEKSGKKSEYIVASELEKYGTEAGNPGNEKQVDFIQVFVPSAILKNGLVIIDTPGLGGLFKEHKKVTYEYVPRADAVFFVTDSVESPIGKAELDLLQDLNGITSHIYFIQTKSAVVDKNSRLARRENNLNILKDAGYGDVASRYFMVDSRLKFEADQYKDIQDLGDSGYPLVMALVEQGLKPNVRDIMIKKAILEFRPRFDAVATKLDSKKRIIYADTAEKRKELQQEIENADKALQEWDKTKLPDMLDDFQKQLEGIQQTAEDTLNECRPGGVVNQCLDKLLTQAESIADLQAVNSSIAEKLPATLSEYYLQITRKLQADIEKVLRSFPLTQNSDNTDIVISPNGSFLDDNTNSPINETVKKCEAFGSFNFDSLRTGLYGGMVGATIASVVGGVIGSVIPFVGTVIGSTAGMAIASFWAGREAIKLKDKQELEKGVQQMRVAISQTLNNFYIDSQLEIRNMLTSIKLDTRSMLRKSIAEQRDALSMRSKELIARAQSDITVLEQDRKEIDELSKQFETILRFVR